MEQDSRAAIRRRAFLAASGGWLGACCWKAGRTRDSVSDGLLWLADRDGGQVHLLDDEWLPCAVGALRAPLDLVGSGATAWCVHAPRGPASVLRRLVRVRRRPGSTSAGGLEVSAFGILEQPRPLQPARGSTWLCCEGPAESLIRVGLLDARGFRWRIEVEDELAGGPFEFAVPLADHGALLGAPGHVVRLDGSGRVAHGQGGFDYLVAAGGG